MATFEEVAAPLRKRWPVTFLESGRPDGTRRLPCCSFPMARGTGALAVPGAAVTEIDLPVPGVAHVVCALPLGQLSTIHKGVQNALGRTRCF